MKELLKNKKIVIPICAVLIVLIGLGIWLAATNGSRSGGKIRESTPEVLDIMEKAEKALESVSSVHSMMEINMDMEVQEMEMDIALQMGIYQLKGEDVQKTETIMSFGDFGSQAVTSYIDMEENIVYSTSDGGMSWEKEKVSQDEAQAYVNNIDFSKFLTGIRNYKEKDAETINGIAATRYDGVIPQDYVKDIVEQTGILEQLGVEDFTENQMKTVCDEIGNINVSMWLDPTTYLPQKMSMDLTKMMKAIMKLNESESAVSDTASAVDALKKVTMTYTQSDYNNLTTIEIPKEAKNAK